MKFSDHTEIKYAGYSFAKWLLVQGIMIYGVVLFLLLMGIANGLWIAYALSAVILGAYAVMLGYFLKKKHKRLKQAALLALLKLLLAPTSTL